MDICKSSAQQKVRASAGAVIDVGTLNSHSSELFLQNELTSYCALLLSHDLHHG